MFDLSLKATCYLKVPKSNMFYVRSKATGCSWRPKQHVCFGVQSDMFYFRPEHHVAFGSKVKCFILGLNNMLHWGFKATAGYEVQSDTFVSDLLQSSLSLGGPCSTIPGFQIHQQDGFQHQRRSFAGFVSLSFIQAVKGVLLWSALENKVLETSQFLCPAIC